MINTLANIQGEVNSRGFIATPVDGIPEGFSFKVPDIIIGSQEWHGLYVVFIPLKEEVISARTINELLEKYNKLCPKK